MPMEYFSVYSQPDGLHDYERPTKAIDDSVPIIAVNVVGKGYSFDDAARLLSFLDTALDTKNSGASKLLQHVGLNMQKTAWKLSSVLSNTMPRICRP